MRNAQKALKKIERKNPLRRVHLSCHGWTRDAVARISEWVWCEPCSDWRRVDSVAE